MRGPAGTGRGGVSISGGREGQGARKGNGRRIHGALVCRPVSSPGENGSIREREREREREKAREGE